MKLLIILTLATAFITSCSSNSTDDLVGPIPVNVTYENDVKSIIESNCIACHQEPSMGGTLISLADYEKVKQAVVSKELINRISRAQGSEGMMPLGGMKLPQNKIDIIVKWRDQGFQN
jgi:hypothetical protein